MEAFLSGASAADSTSAERQIISLGAGTDTRSLRLFSQSSYRDITYHEIDFPAICTKKLNIVKANPALRRCLSEPSLEPTGSWRATSNSGCTFWCHGQDLRDLSKNAGATSLPGLRSDIPTLLISECCLCYLEAEEASTVVKWFMERIKSIGMVLYEPTNPEDAFGKTMVDNLAARHIVMPTLSTYPRPESQITRMQGLGFEDARYRTSDQIWDGWVPEQEKDRVNGREGLDEVEEWNLLANHYVVAWGWRGQGFQGWVNL